MLQYTVLELKQGLNLQMIQQALNNRPSINMTPTGNEWPANDVLKAAFFSSEAGFAIKSLEEAPASFNKIDSNFISANFIIQRPKESWYDRDGQLLPSDLRVTTFRGFILFFNVANTCYAVIDASASSRKVARVKKDLLSAIGLLEFPAGIKAEEVGIPSSYKLDSDFFYWLYYIHIVKKGLASIGNDNIILLELTGFRGSSLEGTQRTNSKGDRIAKLLTTNAFIFSNDNMDSLQFALEYRTEIVNLELSAIGEIKIISHSGEYGKGTSFKQMAAIMLTYKILIPLLQKMYDTAIREGDWGVETLRSFLSEVGSSMLEEIKKIIEQNINAQVEDIATIELG